MKKVDSRGFAPIIGVLVIVFVLGAGLAGGFIIKDQVNLSKVMTSPKKVANLTEIQSTDSSKQTKTEEAITEATPIPTPTFTPTPIPTSTPTPKPTKAPTPTTAPAQTQSNNQLTLTATSDEVGKVKLSWNFSGSLGSGFKTVYNTSPNPTYPQNTWHYLDNSRRDDVFEGLPSGQKLYFRVGIYVGGENPVSLYSDNVEVIVK